MSAHAAAPSKSAKPTKPTSNRSQHQQPTSRSSLSSHLAMVELQQRIVTSLSKLADRATYHIALEDLHSIIQPLSPKALPLLLNSLYDSLSDSSNSKPSVKKESLNLISLVCQSRRDLTLPHLTKIIAHIVKRLKDSDSSVRDACRDAIGILSGLYLKGNSGGGGGDVSGMGAMVGLFVKPLFEAMEEQNKSAQSGGAMCLARLVDCAGDGAAGHAPLGAFQKLCPRICMLLNDQNFQAKAALLGVVSSLAQVGAIAPQGLELLLQSIHDCLGSPDWATRKASADALIALAVHSRSLVADGAANSTLTALGAFRFDKIKPVRDSVIKASKLWKKIAGKGDEVTDDRKASSQDRDHPEEAELLDKRQRPGGKRISSLASDSSSDRDHPEEAELLDKRQRPGGKRISSLASDSSSGTSPVIDSLSKGKGASIPDKAVPILKKKASALTDKKLNPEFFQRLEKRGSDDLPVEVIVPQRCQKSSNVNAEEEKEPNDSESRGKLKRTGHAKSDDLRGSLNSKFHNTDSGICSKDSRIGAFDDERNDVNHRELSGSPAGFSESNGQPEGSSTNNKGNWLAIQRQLLHLERQQSHLMNMLQGFMGGSHNSMVTLENRVRGLERVVEDMAHDLSKASGRRASSYAIGIDASPNRHLSKYHGLPDYSGTKYNNGHPQFGETFPQSDAIEGGLRERGRYWRSDTSDNWDFPSHGSPRNVQVDSRRAQVGDSMDARSPRSEHEIDQVGSRRVWDRGAGPVRLGEGPSARSVWQASKDEATLEAIRVAGEDNGVFRTARVAIPELTAEALEDDNVAQKHDPVWTAWTNAMDALKVGDMDTAYAEVVSIGDDVLLVKLMDMSGPVVDQLSEEIAHEVLYAIGQFLMEPNWFDICLSWIQQLAEMVLENESDILGLSMELKEELLASLYEVCNTQEPPEDWDGVAPDQLLLQLASAWEIEIPQSDK